MFDYLVFLFDEDIISGQNYNDAYFSCDIPIEFFPENFKKMYYENKAYAVEKGYPTMYSRSPEEIKTFENVKNENEIIAIEDGLL